MHSPNITSIVFGGELPTLDDPAETYFEASKFHRETLAADAAGVFFLESNAWLQEVTGRAGKRFDHRPGLALPEPLALRMGLGDALRRRRSRDERDPARPLALDAAATLLHAAYGTNGRLTPHHLGRATPSGGALFPLDVFLFAGNVEGLEPGLHHYDAQRHRLAQVGSATSAQAAATTAQPETLEGVQALVCITGAFWRSRFKYGQRALRFVLLEAGHACQNLLLAAEGLGLHARPIGGFMDDDLADLLDLDGVNEAPLYLAAVGVPSAGGGA